MRLLFSLIFLLIAYHRVFSQDDIDHFNMIHMFDPYKTKCYHKLDSAIKVNDEFEMQKWLNGIFCFSLEHGCFYRWLECSKIFLENERAIASFICYRKASDILIQNIEPEKYDKNWEELIKFCKNNYTEIPYGKCKYLSFIKFYDIINSDILEFIAQYSYPASQFEAFELVNRKYLEDKTLPFESKNTEEDKEKLNCLNNNEPPKVDKEELSENINYPEEALKKGYYTSVVIKTLVSETGSVLETATQINHNMFHKAAIEAIMKTDFTPGTLYGEPIDSWITIPINFKLYVID